MKRKIVLLGAVEIVLAEIGLTPEIGGCSVMLYDKENPSRGY